MTPQPCVAYPGSSSCNSLYSSLGFTYAEYLSSTHWALTLSCRTAILHCNSSWVLDIHLFSTLYTICLHFASPPLQDFSQRLSHSSLLVNRFFTKFVGIFNFVAHNLHKNYKNFTLAISVRVTIDIVGENSLPFLLLKRR